MARSRCTSDGRAEGRLRSRALACIVALLVGCVRGHAAQDLEYPVKAAFLYNIAKFVEWPAGKASGEPVTFCVVGEDPFGHVLDETMRGKRLNNRPVLLRRCAVPREFAACQVLFFSASESRRTRSLLRGLEDAAVLTVGESQGFADYGGMINLLVENGKVGFEVNVKAVERAGLRVRSQLLDLARIVHSAGKGRG